VRKPLSGVAELERGPLAVAPQQLGKGEVHLNLCRDLCAMHKYLCMAPARLYLDRDPLYDGMPLRWGVSSVWNVDEHCCILAW
jgi:hypothetical protein